MRFTLLAVLLSTLHLPASASYIYPSSPDPVNQKHIDLFRANIAKYKSPQFLAFPASTMAMPCEVPPEKLYPLIGLGMALKETKAEIDKQGAKLMRKMGMDMESDHTYSDIRIEPLRAQCVNGKLDGEAEFLVSHSAKMMTKTRVDMLGEATDMTSTMSTKNVSRYQLQLKEGELAGESIVVQLVDAVNTVEYSSPAVKKMMASAPKLPPSKSLMVLMNNSQGHMTTFNEVPSVKVTKGLFMAGVDTGVALQTTLTIPVAPGYVRSLVFMDKDLLGSSGYKNGKPHGEHILYSDNIYKTLGQKLDRQVGMENVKEVVINGKDMLETRNCFINGEQVKVATCPAS